MHAPKVSVHKGTICEDAISQMAEKKAQCCVISDSHGKLSGILRISDILDNVVFKVGPTTLIDEVMDTNVQTIHEDEYLYHAIGRMRRRNVQEIVCVDHAMHPLGVVYLKDAIEAAAFHITQQIDRLSAEGDRDSLRSVKAAQVELASDMFDDNIAAPEIQQLLTHVNNDIYGRIITDNMNNMEAEGWGRPPVAFCAIVMGSGGRGENYLYPDQDNGFILEDYPDEDHTRIDHYFRELSCRMCRDLDNVGFPYCNGNVMASNPLWRKSYSQWVDQVKLWGRKRNSVALRLADIFFDFQPVWGKRTLATDLRAEVLRQIRSNHFFLSEMFASQVQHNVALGLFNRLATEKGNDTHRGEIDLKYRGNLPLVEAVRLLALKQGIGETSTLQRIKKLHQANILSESEADYLTTAFSFITQVLLKRQVGEFKANRPINCFIKTRLLSKREKENLTNALRHIQAFRKRIKGEMTGDVF